MTSLTFNRFFRQARRDLREGKADKVRPVEETVSLLRDMAKRQMRAEASSDGTVHFLFTASSPSPLCHRAPVWKRPGVDTGSFTCSERLFEQV